jgi:hypothetical protein
VDWLKLSVDLPDHPKVAELSDRAFRALIASWCYVARFETRDGLLPDAAAVKVGLTTKLATELEGAGLLHRNQVGWHVHDWQEHQADAEALRRIRENARNRRKAYRERQKEQE